MRVLVLTSHQCDFLPSRVRDHEDTSLSELNGKISSCINTTNKEEGGKSVVYSCWTACINESMCHLEG